MVVRDLHVEGRARVAEILASEDGALLTDEQRGGVSVAADVVGADGQIGDLEILGAVHIQALVEHTVLDN